MNISPASNTQLADVDRACRDFRAYWLSFDSMPFTCQFAGTLDDVTALDFLSYEGLGYPVSYLAGASFVWGNVLSKQLGMSWMSGCNGELLLTHDAPGDQVTFWPFARVLEAQERSHPQDGRYAWLLDRAIRDCLQSGNLSEEAIAWSQGVLDDWDRNGTPWS